MTRGLSALPTNAWPIQAFFWLEWGRGGPISLGAANLLRQVEREMNTRPGCCHSHLRAKWKSRPYLEGQSRRDDLKVAQDVSPG